MSTARPRVDAMRPSTPGRTRTADPRPPDQFPSEGGYRGYLAFGFGGFFLFTVGLLMLRAVWALGNGEAAWDGVVSSFANPIYLVFHAVALVWLVWFALRLFTLFPKTQPKRFGPVQAPPAAAMVGLLTVVFIGASALVGAILWGALS